MVMLLGSWPDTVAFLLCAEAVLADVFSGLWGISTYNSRVVNTNGPSTTGAALGRHKVISSTTHVHVIDNKILISIKDMQDW